MTTKLIPIESITVVKHDRQRKDLSNIDELAASFKRTGQINPISVTPDLILIAGERRLTAAKQLGWDSVLCTIREDEPTEAQRLVELEENVAREELPWKDHCIAILDLHELLSAQEPEWSQGRTAKYIGQSATWTNRRLTVARALVAGDEFVCAADRFSVADNYLVRKAEREAGNEEDAIDAMLGGGNNPAPTGTTPKEPLPDTDIRDTTGPRERSGVVDQLESAQASIPMPEQPPAPFELADFNEWAASYSGPKFNFLHCDFPYGINVEKHHGAGSSHKGYDDSKDVYFALLDTLAAFTAAHVAKSAHLMFWYAFRYHAETVAALTDMGWNVQERPLIWYRSDNSGVLPDPKRGPRWVYETCLMATRGDRPVVQPVSNLVAFPNQKDIHKSEKPVNMLHHFFRMFVDSSTVMLDPTAGSGNAVYTAEGMGAKFALGLERDPEFLEAAVAQYHKNKAMFKEV